MTPHGQLDGRVAVVTGAGQGIGAAITDRFLAEGAIVYKCDVTPMVGDAARLHSRELDVRDLSAWVSLGCEIDEAYGRLDVLVNNAGIVGSYAKADEIDTDTWDDVLAVNLTGAFYGTRVAIPLMRTGGGGSIVNVSSIWGIIGASGVAAYQASKGGLRTFTKNVALTYGPENIRANSVYPGIVDTPLVQAQPREMNDRLVADTPLGRMAMPGEIAAAVLFLSSDESSFMTGSELVIDGGYTVQ